ncbi:MAG: two-component sensor histidine kinase, partial [Gammaproteobacteria bacterium]
KDVRAAELVIANEEKAARVAELVIANEEKAARVAELVIANEDKDARVAELVIANEEKDARAAELVIANEDKDARAAELVIANEKLIYESDEKEVRAAELQEKEVLLKENHHRVKNNLQVISSMLSLQAGTTPHTAVKKALGESQRRIRVMARVHESLHQSNNLSAINIRDYINAIVADTTEISMIDQQKILTHVVVDKMNIDIDTATVCGQIFSELYSNCIKHAFPDERSGSIEVAMHRADKGRIELTVVDDGIGLPKGFNTHQSATLGLKLVNALVTQLQGKIHIEGSHGTAIRVTFEGKQ